ncbi:proteasome subunit beta type-4 [Procambarus clarkii]|uniref:proteasome subunit beta type-4 n=1 Tax=Procambarus clarkii TaxID=6728 RepID=UPI001E672079|nr:proteasome subunit beta type-4-like [Procambarus clarkii]
MADVGASRLPNFSLWSGGPTPGEFYHFPGHNKLNDAKSHTMYPSTSGTSVVGLVYDGGVMLVADSLGSYGSLARFRDVKRLFKVTDKAALACSGDIADYQFIREVIEQKVRDDVCGGYSRELNAGALHCWLTRVLYNRRSRFDPLWLECIVAGYKDDKPFLGYVDKIGTAFEAKEVATGFGLHLAVPMIREAREKKQSLPRDEARKLLTECLKVLYYRDCRAHFKYQLADITPEGVVIHDDLNLKKDTNWEVANYISGYE